VRLAALCAVVVLWSGAARAEPMLPPGQSAVLRAAVGEGGDSLGGDWRIDGFAVERERVVVRLAGPDGARAEALIRGQAGADGAFETPLGWVELPAALPAEAAAALRSRLAAAPRSLEWREAAGAPPDAGDASGPVALDLTAARSARDAVQARLAGRRGLGPPAPRAALLPPVDGALDALLAGDPERARAALDTLVVPALAASPASLPDGALSVWLAAGGHPDAPVHALAERFPDEPRVAALFSRALRADGAHAAAADWVAHGLAAPLGDALLLEEARALGLSAADPAPWDLPAPPPPPTAPAWPWQAAALALALALAASAIRHRSAEALLALIAAALAAAWAVPSPPDRPFPDLPPELLAPVAGGPCSSAPARRDGATLVVHARCPSGPLTLVIHPAAPNAAPPPNARTTAAHTVSIPALRRPPPAAAAVLATLTAHLAAAESTGFRLLPPPPPPPRAARPTFAAASPALRAELRLGAATLAAAALLALLTLARALAAAARAWPPRTPAARATAAAAAVALATHALAPAHMIMVYGGYGLVSDLAAGTIPRYGVGTLFAYGPLLWALPPDHATIQLANRALGLASLALAYTLGARLIARTPTARAALAWLLALLPVIPFDHASESIVVAPTVLALAALLRLTAPSPSPPRGVLAATLLAAAALCRPELLVVAALTPLWLLAVRALPPPAARRAAAAFALAAAPILAVQLAQALTRSAALHDQGALPGLMTPIAAAISGITHRSIFAHPTYVPPVVTALLLAALALPGPHRRAALATAALAAAWLAATAIDLVDISIPRLHMPALLLLLPAAAVGFALLLDHAPRLRLPPPTAAALAAVLLLAGSAYSASRLYRPTNEAAEERFWRDTAAVLHQTGGCVATLDYPDPPAPGKTPRFVPAYLLPEPPDRHPLYPLAELPLATRACPGPVYVALGLRCYAAYRDDDAPAPATAAPLPACAAALARPDLVAVFERDLPNRGDLGFPLYPSAPTLRVGLYRVSPAP
jgi:hypothetical protein